MPILDLSFQSIIVRVLAGSIVATLLGTLLAWTADRLGNPGPKYDGRLSLFPPRHTSLLSLIATTASLVGWTRLLVLEPDSSRRLVGIALTGEIVLFSFGLSVTLLPPLVVVYWPDASASFALATVGALRDTSFGFALLNMLPVPPLLGGYVLQAFAPVAFGAFARAGSAVCIFLAACSLVLHGIVSSNPVATVLGKAL